MSNAKHTPGPWTYERKLASQGDYHDKRACIFAHGDVIGQAYQGGDNALNAQANARLMAAAPDLAEALRALLAEVDEMTKRVGWAGNGGRERASAALAKAGLS